MSRNWIIYITEIVAGAFVTAAAFQVSSFVGLITAAVVVVIAGITLFVLQATIGPEGPLLTVRKPTRKKKSKASVFWRDTGERMTKTFGQAFLSTFIVPGDLTGLTKVALAATAAGLSAVTSMGSKGFGANENNASLIK